MRDTAERFTQIVGRRIAELRRHRGWTQQQFADKLRIDVSAVQRIERGAHAPTLGTIWRLAKVLRVEPAQLLVPPAVETETRAGRPPKRAAAEEAVTFAVLPGVPPSK